jgi:uncharacterized repeat protein (TIGR02543 family)
MTISAWVYATANPADDGQLVAKSDGAGWQFKTSPDTGPHTFAIAVSPTSASLVQRYSATVRALNTWYYVAGVYDATARTLDIYVNGVKDNGVLSGTVPATQYNASTEVTLGRRTGGFYFAGRIDEARIYNRALTASEIQTDMNTPIGGASSPPPSTYALTIAKSGTGSGTVTSSPVGITCGSVCSASFTGGPVVTLTATPTTGATFTGWSGGGCSGTGTCAVTLSAATTVTATFSSTPPPPTSYTLSVTKSGSGTVNSSPAGIACGATCSAAFGSNTAVTLTATPATDFTFAGWGGDCAGTGPCTLTMTQGKNVTATFTAGQPPAPITYTLLVAKNGTGRGTVGSTPAGITCGSKCSASFTNGTTVTLTAFPVMGSTFTGWSGACTGTGSCVVPMNQAKNVTATFNKRR